MNKSLQIILTNLILRSKKALYRMKWKNRKKKIQEKAQS